MKCDKFMSMNSSLEPCLKSCNNANLFQLMRDISPRCQKDIRHGVVATGTAVFYELV